MHGFMFKNFEPLERIPLDIEHQLEQTVGQFSSLKNGLPELVKNSKDAYARNNIMDKDKRIIIVLLENSNRDNSTRLGVLDFAGATINDFEGEKEEEYGGWITWSSRSAGKSRLSIDIEAGYGNGGKSFMAAGSTRESSMHSSKNNRRTKMGFRPEMLFKPGYYLEDGQKIRNITDHEPNESLKKTLLPYSISFEEIIEICPEFLDRNNWTFVELIGIKDIADKWDKYSIDIAINTLKTHGQASLTIDTSNVYVIVNGKLYEGPITRELPEPLEYFKDPFEYSIPNTLIDPISKEVIDFNQGTDEKLIIYTSKKVLKLRPNHQPINTLRIKSDRNIVAVYPMGELASMGVSGQLYGNITCSSLSSDDYMGQLRLRLNDTKLTRALMNWISECLLEISEEVHKQVSENHTFKEKTEVEEKLDIFRDLMKDFLEKGDIFSGSDSGSKPGGKNKKKKNPPGEIDRVRLEDDIGFLSIPIGIKIPVKHEAIDANNKIVPHRNFRWESEPRNILEFDGGGNIKGLAAGKASLWIEEIESGIRSDILTITVEDIVNVSFAPQKNILKQGEKISLNIQAINTEGYVPSRLALKYDVLPKDHGRVGRLGFFSAGNEKGRVKITASYGPNEADKSECYIEISDEKKKIIKTEFSGGGAPYIILCGNEAPGCTDFPEQQRTHKTNPEEPTIIMYEPFWRKRNIIWINPESAESKRVRRRTKGSSILGKLTTKTYTEFLVLKTFEILKLIKAEQIIGETEKITPMQMIETLAMAETDVSKYIETAFEIVDGWYVNE